MGARTPSRKSTELIEPRNGLIEEADAVELAAGNRNRIEMARVDFFLRGQRGWRGGMTREAGGQMRPYGFRDGGTGTSAEHEVTG